MKQRMIGPPTATTTAFQYEIAPLSLALALNVALPDARFYLGGWIPPFYWGWPTLAINPGVWLFNFTKNVSVDT